jgi:hypothetical protein
MLTGWDAALIANFQLADGTTIEKVASDLNTALGALNAELNSDPFIAGIASFTDQLTVEYRTGSSNGFEDHTEYGTPDGKRAEVAGHMLPLKKKDRSLKWTFDYLEDARAPQIEADIADAIKDARDLVRVAVLTRLFKRGDDSGASVGLSATGLSAGFATAAASTGVDFTPPSYGGTAFDSNHEHYVGITGGAWTKAAFQDMYDELREHGHEPPFDFITGPSDRAAVEALSGFTGPSTSLVRLGTSANVAVIDASQYFGTMLGYFQLREVRGIPQYYGAAYKSYGPRSQRNPLRIRVKRGDSNLQVIAMPDPRNGSMAHPLQSLMLATQIGVGVGDRTAATPRYNNSGTWTDGTPT